VSDADGRSMLDKIDTLAREGDWWILAGSAPPGIQPSFVKEIIHRIQDAGAFVILDMEGEYLRQGCNAHAFLVKPNATEAYGLIGDQINSIQNALEGAVKIHKIGAHRVVISMGKAGAVYSDGSGTWWAEPPAIVERNPIGAGDAMLAGLVWALHKELCGSDVLRWGIACGSAAASLDGTAVGSRELVESLATEVRITC